RPTRPYWFLRTKGMARPVFSPDSRLVAAVGHLALSDDDVAPKHRKQELLSTQVFDPATGQPLGPELPVGVPILDGCFSPDGSIMALACAVAERSKQTVLLPDGKAGSMQLWDWKTGKQIGEPIAMPSEPHTIVWHPSKGQIAIGCAAGQTLKIDVASRKVSTLFEAKVEHQTWRWHPGEWDSCSMSFAAGGDQLLWCFGGQSHVLDFRKGSIRYSPPTWKSWSTSLTSRNDVYLNSFVNHAPRALRLTQDRGWKWIKKPNDSDILTLGSGSVAKLSRDGRYVVCGGIVAHTTQVHDLEWRRIACPPFGDGATDVDFIYGTPFVVTAVEGNPWTVHFWDRISGRIAAPTLEIPGCDLLTWIRVAENGRFAAMTCHPYGLLVCDLQSFHDNPLQRVSPQDAMNLAIMNSGSQIYSGRMSKLLEGEKWIELWDDFASRHPDFHRVDIPLDLAIRDHQTRAAEFETLNNTTAAAFHRRMANALLEKPDAVKPEPAKVPAGLESDLATLTRAIEDQPERAAAWRDRAAWFASNRQWQLAADDLTKVLEMTPDDSQSYLRLSPLLILAGNHDGYRSICREMLKQFDDATAETTVEQTIKTCLLQPEAMDLAALPIETLDKVLSADEPTHMMLAWGSATRALYAFRAGDAQAAVDWADKSLDHSISSQQQALALAIQALSLRQLGDLKKAGEKLGMATDLIESALAEFSQDRNLRGWQDWLIADILRTEAEQETKILSKNPDGATDD
ncbi:MAG: WD40 repeat domain-containing protein, partial [Planctomycetales bacterium]|nr:WD40 repeat domain-containing protein [Planctomycetales bacterium]